MENDNHELYNALDEIEQEYESIQREQEFTDGHKLALKRKWTFTRFVKYGKRLKIDYDEERWTVDYFNFCRALLHYCYTMKDWHNESIKTIEDANKI